MTNKASAFETGKIAVRPLSKEMIKDSNTLIVPPGSYWFGDPCYVVGKSEFDKEWQQWVKFSEELSNGFIDAAAGALYNDFAIMSMNTLYGDGLYDGNNGVQYGSDAGSLGLIPAELPEKMGIKKEDYENLGSFIEVKEETEFSRDSEGTIKLGDFEVRTGD